MLDVAAEDRQPVDPQVREQLLEPFIAATCAALSEMAGTDLVVSSVFQLPFRPGSNGIAAEVELSSAFVRSLIVSFPIETARSLAGRILAGVAEPDNGLVADCVAEIANVVAGQAKALLAGGPYHFAFSVPKILPGTPSADSEQCQGTLLGVIFGSEHGDFTLLLRQA